MQSEREEKKKEYDRNYYTEHREECLKRSREYYKKNRDKLCTIRAVRKKDKTREVKKRVPYRWVDEKTKSSIEKNKALVKEYEKGKIKQRELAEKYGISRQRVSQIIKKYSQSKI